MSAENQLDTLKVNYGHLDSIAEELKNRRTQIETQMDAIWAEVKKVDQAWEGEAKEMFRAIDKQWHARANDIKAQLDKVEKLIHEGKGHYHMTDKKGASLFQQISGQVSGW
ncbi:WXG100 family type VII secretion target [Streptomyces spirodelae]|uniref:ESAT-6-like protein n=1 Tax=Streptomyces spirodelae TaxID=2812904 RepID=A0ABS3X3H0_9ACTN|nr:WXG100 family type VII secretion target [Streptomyces spirodelae]MBO8189651.1 WXG100 family type VII secretion target [Streptomyces spirodelae]